MALEITGEVKLDGGITLPSCYARTFYKVFVDSNEVKVGALFYASKSSYENGLGAINAHIGFNSTFEYNRDVDGSDILYFTQVKVKEALEEQGYSVVITDVE